MIIAHNCNIALTTVLALALHLFYIMTIRSSVKIVRLVHKPLVGSSCLRHSLQRFLRSGERKVLFNSDNTLHLQTTYQLNKFLIILRVACH
jgi:hypothetical protein